MKKINKKTHKWTTFGKVPVGETFWFDGDGYTKHNELEVRDLSQTTNCWYDFNANKRVKVLSEVKLRGDPIAKPVWQNIADDAVRTVWACQEETCVNRSIVEYFSPKWHQDNGTPVCDCCKENMKYYRTEIKTQMVKT